MSTGIQVLVGYFVCGLMALALFDIVTGRLRSNWSGSVTDTMVRLSEVNVPLGAKVAAVLLASVLWLFWPAVLYSAVREVIDERKGVL